MKRRNALVLLAAAVLLAGACIALWRLRTPEQPANGQDPAVATYVARRFDGMASNGGSVFVSYDLMGERVEGDTKELYVWALIQELYVEDGALQSGSGTSQPIKVVSRLRDGAWVPESDETTADGSGHADGVRRIFPKQVQDKIFANADVYDARVDLLEARNRAAAADHYGFESS